ncbi:MAG: hypothetical protein ABIE55_01080 [Candidatus Aenigmatarchaeota archaeon]
MSEEFIKKMKEFNNSVEAAILNPGKYTFCPGQGKFVHHEEKIVYSSYSNSFQPAWAVNPKDRVDSPIAGEIYALMKLIKEGALRKDK